MTNETTTAKQRTAAETVSEIDRDFRSWKVTPEEADRIAAGDRDAMNDFYFRNYGHLQQIARAYARRRNLELGCVVYIMDELLAQLWIDLPALNWRNAYTLTMSIKFLSFAWAPYGGYTQRKESGSYHSNMPCNMLITDTLSLDACVKGNGEEGDEFLLMDCVADEDTPETLALAAEANEMNGEEIAELLTDYLSPKCRKWLALYLNGSPYSAIAHTMRVTDPSEYARKVHETLVINFPEVVERLRAAGLNIPKSFGIPSDFADMHIKRERRRAQKHVKDEDRKRPFTRHATDEEREAAERASKRAYYERNKELQNERRRQRRAAARTAKVAAEGARA